MKYKINISYINEYICVCLCVCVCVYIYIYGIDESICRAEIETQT